jgi:hypothetical protein
MNDLLNSLTTDDSLMTELMPNQSQTYITNDGQSASLSWIKAPIWGLRLYSYFYYCQTIAGLLVWGALSDERTGLLFTIAAGPRQRILGSKSRGTRDHILLSQIRDFLFIASYDSQGCGRGNRPRLHTGIL